MVVGVKLIEVAVTLIEMKVDIVIINYVLFNHINTRYIFPDENP